jgi:hypothetical protein
MSSPCAVLCQCCCIPPRSPLSLAQFRGPVVPSWPSTASLPRYSEERTAVRIVVVEVVVVVVWGLAVVVARAAGVAVRRPRAVARFALWFERAAV